MPRLLPLVLLAAVAAAPAWAQGVLTFDAETHGFGRIEEGAKPTHTFRFTNTGDQPVTLTRVRPACGCTTPAYTVAPVAPGEEGLIEVTYDSKGRPGAFDKSILVQADGAEPERYTLRIVGEVVPVTLTSTSAPQGAILFEVDRFEAAPVDGAVTHAFTFQSQSQRPVKFLSARSIPEGAEVVLPARPVFLNEVGEVAVTLPAALVGAKGADVAILVETDDAAQPVKSLRLVAKAPAASADLSAN